MKPAIVCRLLFPRRSRFPLPPPSTSLQKPAMNKTEIVFSYAGDLWTVSRQGGMATRLTAGAGFRNRSRVFARWNHHRVYRRIRRQHRCVHDAGGGWTPSASRIIPTPIAWWAGLPTASAFCSARIATASRASRSFSRSRRRRYGGRAAAADGLHRLLFAGRQAHGLPAARWRPVRHRVHQFRLLEALSRRRSQLSVDREFGRPEHRENSAHGFERYQSHVDRRQDLFPVRSQRPHVAVPLRPAEQGRRRS